MSHSAGGCTGLEHALGDGIADAACAAGDDGGSAFQIYWFMALPLRLCRPLGRSLTATHLVGEIGNARMLMMFVAAIDVDDLASHAAAEFREQEQR